MSQLIIYVISFVQLTNYVDMFAGENKLYLLCTVFNSNVIGMC